MRINPCRPIPPPPHAHAATQPHQRHHSTKKDNILEWSVMTLTQLTVNPSYTDNLDWQWHCLLNQGLLKGEMFRFDRFPVPMEITGPVEKNKKRRKEEVQIFFSKEQTRVS